MKKYFVLIFNFLFFFSESPKKTNKMIFQRLPKKMRRRVMSTTVKRMPKDLQLAHRKSVGITEHLLWLYR